MKNMVEESGWIVKSQAGWPKKCIREIPTYWHQYQITRHFCI
jgi:hypothetical protein